MYEMEIKTAKENNSNMLMVKEQWGLGPIKTSIQSNDNKEFWSNIAKAWMVDEEEARTMLCANCEYFDNTSEMMLQMNKIPLDTFDLDGGGRGYCNKFEFICHNLRTCKAWEPREFKLVDNEEFNSMIMRVKK